MNGRIRVGLLVCVAALVLGGCGGGGNSVPTEDRLGDIGGGSDDIRLTDPAKEQLKALAIAFAQVKCDMTSIGEATGFRFVQGTAITLRGDLLLGTAEWPGQSYVNGELHPEGSPYAGWGHNKAVFARVPGYSGELVITGREVDGDGEVRFAHGGERVVIPAGVDSEVDGMLVPASGCYQIEVNGEPGWGLTFRTELCEAKRRDGALPACR